MPSFFFGMTIMAKTIQIYTVQMAKWRLARELGIHFLDITAKSGQPEFAPMYEDVMAFKHHKLNWDEYEKIYRQRMWQSKRDNPEAWAKLKELPEKVALACYCKPDERHCHRHIFKEILGDYLKDAHYDVSFKGELTTYLPTPKQDALEKTCT
jgi:uncharacterized protein YeaO (DUF488 family)